MEKESKKSHSSRKSLRRERERERKKVVRNWTRERERERSRKLHRREWERGGKSRKFHRRERREREKKRKLEVTERKRKNWEVIQGRKKESRKLYRRERKFYLYLFIVKSANKFVYRIDTELLTIDSSSISCSFFCGDESQFQFHRATGNCNGVEISTRKRWLLSQNKCIFLFTQHLPKRNVGLIESLIEAGNNRAETSHDWSFDCQLESKEEMEERGLAAAAVVSSSSDNCYVEMYGEGNERKRKKSNIIIVAFSGQIFIHFNDAKFSAHYHCQIYNRTWVYKSSPKFLSIFFHSLLIFFGGRGEN